MIVGLRANGVDLRLLAARQPFSHGCRPADLPNLTIIEVSAPAGLRHRWANLRQPHGDLARHEFDEVLRQMASEVDVVHLDQIDTARCAAGVARPLVAGLHYRVRLDQDLGPPWRRQFRQVLEFDRSERAAARRHPWLVANSGRVADSLRRTAPGAQVIVSPLCLDPEGYEVFPHLARPTTAGLIGTAAWPPTADAVRRLRAAIWPEVRRRRPEARLEIAGRGLAPAPPGSGLDGVDVLGEVPSASEFLSGLAVLAYPVGRGSGMKVKVVESLALGVPVVTTSEGAEGVPASDGVVVAEDDVGLAGAIESILGDPLERAERSAAARRTFEEHLTPVVATSPLADLYQRMAGR